MELNYRKGHDAFVAPGAYQALEGKLRDQGVDFAEMPIAVLACFDPSTRLMPFMLYDKYIFPAGARLIAGALQQAGFTNTRAIYQLWNPNFKPSQAKLQGKPLQMLLLSTMELHSRRAYEAVEDAWTLGEDRPLLLVGGPKAFHQPYHFWSLPSKQGPIEVDAAITGEAFVLLDLLNLLQFYRLPGEPMRKAFERARKERALNQVPGLVYRDPDSTVQAPILIDTGLQKLVQHLDELPDEVVGLSVLETPHRGKGLQSAPLADKYVRKHAQVVSLLITQGCKFSCSYCPIPALNQKTWRFRSPEGFVRQLQSVRERFGIKYYFGADDNFFNRRQTAEDFFEAVAKARTSRGKRLGHQVRWGTEATQFDTHKNRDLLPLASKAGLFAIWFGIEDLTAELVNKGQKPENAVELFKVMHQNKICPMAMMMYHDSQPYHSKGSLYGIVNQADFLFKSGAVSIQIGNHIPAVGTREYEKTYETGQVLAQLGSKPVTESKIDGNHVIVQGVEPAWRKQLKFMSSYFAFYNPLNLLRSLRKNGSPLRNYRLGFQVMGMFGAALAFLRLIPYLLRLKFAKRVYHQTTPPLSKVPVHLAPGAFPRFPDGAFYTQDTPAPAPELIEQEAA